MYGYLYSCKSAKNRLDWLQIKPSEMDTMQSSAPLKYCSECVIQQHVDYFSPFYESFSAISHIEGSTPIMALMESPKMVEAGKMLLHWRFALPSAEECEGLVSALAASCMQGAESAWQIC